MRACLLILAFNRPACGPIDRCCLLLKPCSNLISFPVSSTCCSSGHSAPVCLPTVQRLLHISVTMRHPAARAPQGHPLQCTKGVRKCHLVARAVAPDMVSEQAPGAGDNPLSFEPEELVLGPGELSPMNRKPSDEAFQCAGCMDAACQVPSCFMVSLSGVRRSKDDCCGL